MVREATFLTVTIGLPPPHCRPNSRQAHWAQRHRAVKAYRQEAYLVAVAARNSDTQITGLPWRAARVEVTFYHRDRRRRDPDNLRASLKAAFDGIVDAGILTDDDRLMHLPIRCEVDPADPRVEITLTPTDP